MITGWGYTEETKKLLPRPLTSDVLREADVYILPPDDCIKYSPFPITDKELKTKIYKIDVGFSLDDLHVQRTSRS